MESVKNEKGYSDGIMLSSWTGLLGELWCIYPSLWGPLKGPILITPLDHWIGKRARDHDDRSIIQRQRNYHERS